MVKEKKRQQAVEVRHTESERGGHTGVSRETADSSGAVRTGKRKAIRRRQWPVTYFT